LGTKSKPIQKPMGQSRAGEAAARAWVHP
jgi:hypothetical protein